MKSKTDTGNHKPAEVKLDRKPTRELPKDPQLTIDQKIQKVSDLNALIAKRNRFLDAGTKLNSFNLKREDSITRITIQDQEGNQFVTSQTDAIEKILAVLSDSISKGLNETEAKIEF